ncbi:MAG: alpha/beta fold hydrolase [Planctomycetes bacterium]|nr:alpha/beta fold hydrolase [Planctomycetota bacterium]
MTLIHQTAALALLALLAAGPVVAESRVPEAPPASPAVAGLCLEGAATVPAARAEASKDGEDVKIKTQDGQELSATFYASKKKNRAPAVLLVHDAGANRSPFEKIAEGLQKRGFAVLAIDLRGHGGSVTADFDWKACTKEDQTKLWAFAQRDLEAATAFLRDRDGVHNSNLSLVGVGAGAALVTKYALQDENARAVVLVDPQPEAYGYDMYRDVFDLGGLPTMILAPSEDRQQAERLQKAAHEGNNGVEYVQFKVLKPEKDGGPLTDKRLSKTVTDFLQDEAMDKR